MGLVMGAFGIFGVTVLSEFAVCGGLAAFGDA